MIGSMAKKWASEDNQERALHLGEIEQRLATSSQLLRVALAPLASKIEEVAAVAEAAVRKQIFPIVFYFYVHWRSGAHSVGDQEACMNKSWSKAQWPLLLLRIGARSNDLRWLIVVGDFLGQFARIVSRCFSSHGALVL